MASFLPFGRAARGAFVRPLWAWGVALFVCLGITSPAWSQPSDRATAEALFRAGREAMQRGDYEQACIRFAESNRLDPQLGSVLNLAACNEKLGHIAEAWRYYREVVDRAPAGDDRIVIAKARAEALEASLGRLTISLGSGAPQNAVVIKDGIELGAGSLGIELPVNPGKHTLVVRAPGHDDKTVEVSLQPGERREVALEAGPTKPEGAAPTTPGSETSPAAPPHTEASGGHSTLSYILIGVGAAGLVTAAIAGAEVLAKKSTVEDHCVDKVCDREGYDAGRAGRTFSTIGTISFVVGAAALGGGIVLFTTSGGSEKPQEQARVPNGFLATMRGRF